jgi:uncharacterized membrane protein YfcA
VSDQGDVSGGVSGHALPTSAWVMSWAWLAGQAVSVAQRGFQDNELGLALLSMLLSGLVVGWFAAGVLRGRKVRVVIVWVLTVLLAVLELVGLFVSLDAGDFLWTLAALATSLVTIAAFARFCRSDYYRWQRDRPAEQGPRIGQLVTIGVVVGVLGGLVGPVEGQSVNVNISVAEAGPGGQLRR